MPSGHTNTETINQRQPLSLMMRGLLEVMILPTAVLRWDSLSQKEKNCMRALSDRGYAMQATAAGGRRGYVITDAGREALKQ
jgi:hypothetical protein